MNKRAIAILGAIFILIVGTLGFLIYSKTAKKNPQSATTPPPPVAVGNQNNDNVNSGNSGNQNNNTNNSGNQNNGGGEQFVKLTSDQVVSPVLFYNGAGVTYFDKRGQLFQSDFQENNDSLTLAQKRQLSIPQKAGITKILWPQKGDSFIAEIDSSAGKTWSLYNSQTGGYVDFPPQTTSVGWMPTGDKIMYVWLENGKATLNLSNPDTTGWKQVAEMWETDDDINVSPDGQSVVYYRTDSQDISNAINLTTPDGKLWKSLVKDGYNFGVLWSPDSQKFLFGKKDRNTLQYKLWYYNVQTGEVKNLGLATTVDKAVWTNDSAAVYAAVPASGSSASNSLTSDTIVRIDTATMEKKEFISSGLTIDGENLLLNNAETRLFFQNAQDGGLYYLDLSGQ
jgi:hypothetical protein